MNDPNEGDNTGAELEFTWDPVKAASNLTKHAVAIAQAATVFADALALTVFDEARAREATRNERRQYENEPR